MMKCKVEGCPNTRVLAARGLCWTHYQRQRRTGRLDKEPVPDVWSYVDRRNGPESCWTWLGGICGSGYGVVRRPSMSRERYVHRFFYEVTHGPIPSGMTVDHLCFNTLCCNPKHLRLLTLSENAANKRTSVRRRGYRRARCQHRINGVLPPQYVYTSPQGNSYCRVCQTERYVKWQRKRVADLRAARRLLFGAMVS